MFRSKLLILFSLLTMAVLLIGCGAKSMAYPDVYQSEVPAASPVSEEGYLYDYASKDTQLVYAENASGGVANSAPAADVDRIIIKTANLTLVVIDPPASMENIKTLAEKMGGYVVASQLYQTTLDNGLTVPFGSISIRVPAEKLDEALGQIRSESDQLPLSENTDSQDITNEYVNLESRLKNLEAAEVQLTAIMEEAKRTEDVLAVYNELVQIREQIEVIKGQMKYYSESAAFSLVNVELKADAAEQPLTIAGWQPLGVVKEFDPIVN